MFKGITVVLMGLVLCVSSPWMVVAQEETETDFVSGNVTQISAESLTIEAFGGEENNVFIINDETTIENMAAIEELNIGDTVFIDFTEKDGKNIAVNIFKSTRSYDEESLEGSDEGLPEDLPEDFDNEQEEKE